jgi:hypothetical protein
MDYELSETISYEFFFPIIKLVSRFQPALRLKVIYLTNDGFQKG